MIRYLPVLMVALGLILVSTSFAAAHTIAESPVVADAVCVDIEAEASVPDTAGQVLGRCWKKAGLGLLIPGCNAYGELPDSKISFQPAPVIRWLPSFDPVLIDGPPPPLDEPPPKA